jgi:hypothetical protein
MMQDEMRAMMARYRRSVDDEGRSLKDPHFALDKLRVLYGKFDDKERLMANIVLAEWIVSEDESLRFDALSLIRHFEIRSALPALEELASHLATRADPEAPFELEKVQRIMARLSSC